MAMCLGILPKRQAKYLASIFRDSPKCNVVFKYRGRGKRKELAPASEINSNGDLPMKYAKEVAVYVYEKNGINY